MKKTFIKVLSLILVLSMAFSVSAAEFEAGKHADSSVVNIKGTIATENIVENKKVTVSIIEDLDLASERVAHIEELEVDGLGNFASKFVCKASDNSQLKVCYNGEVINDTLIEADIDGVSRLMNVNIVLLSDRGGAFNQKDWGAMPVHSYIDTEHNINATYQSNYTFKKTAGVQAYIKVENTYGLDESFSPIIACYGENNRLLGTKIFDKETINFADPVKTIQTDIIDLPDGTIRAKAFAWNKDEFIPFGDSNEGELDKINVILVGASTAQSWPAAYYPEEGFGRFLGDYFNPDYVNYYNKSVSGASTTTFLDDQKNLGNWDSALTGVTGSVMDIVREGEAKGIPSYVIIELGGNDRNSTSEEQFKTNLLKMYNDVIAKGGKVIFAGVTADAGTIKDGKFVFSSSRAEMTGYKRDIAELTGSDFITAEQKITDFYNSEITRLGSTDEVIGHYFRVGEYLIKDFGITTSNLGYKEKDTTHTNVRGADAAAQKFYEAIVESDSILKAYTK